MSEKTVTVDQVMAWRPCAEYTRERVDALFAGREVMTARDIIALTNQPYNVPYEDIAWALLHREFLSESDMRLAACDFAESVLLIFEREYPDDPRPRRAIEAGRAYARGEIDAAARDAASDAARDAASDAAWDAPSDAAWDAAWAAARAAARAAAWAAAWAAARDAAWAAAWAAARDAASDAAWDAAWDEQLETLLRYIEDNHE